MDLNLLSFPEKMSSMVNIKKQLIPVLLSREDVLYGEFTVQPIVGGLELVLLSREDVLCSEFTKQLIPGGWAGVCPPLEGRCPLR